MSFRRSNVSWQQWIGIHWDTLHIYKEEVLAQGYKTVRDCISWPMNVSLCLLRHKTMALIKYFSVGARHCVFSPHTMSQNTLWSQHQIKWHFFWSTSLFTVIRRGQWANLRTWSDRWCSGWSIGHLSWKIHASLESITKGRMIKLQ